MRILFFPHEQYLPFEYEASNFEVRLPAINCGLITDSETFVYQRVFRSQGREEMNKQAWEFAKSFSPDVVIHFRTWPFPVDENLDHSLINTIDRDGMMKGYDFELVKLIRDSHNLPMSILGGAS